MCIAADAYAWQNRNKAEGEFAGLWHTFGQFQPLRKLSEDEMKEADNWKDGCIAAFKKGIADRNLAANTLVKTKSQYEAIVNAVRVVCVLVCCCALALTLSLSHAVGGQR